MLCTACDFCLLELNVTITLLHLHNLYSFITSYFLFCKSFRFQNVICSGKMAHILWPVCTWTFKGILCTCRFLWVSAPSFMCKVTDYLQWLTGVYFTMQICPYNAIQFLPRKEHMPKDTRPRGKQHRGKNLSKWLVSVFRGACTTVFLVLPEKVAVFEVCRPLIYVWEVRHYPLCNSELSFTTD